MADTFGASELNHVLHAMADFPATEASLDRTIQAFRPAMAPCGRARWPTS